MGYDDNTPLTGVTGGGLPAEIWHETMVRVHEGMEPVALPMRAPIPSTQAPKRARQERQNKSILDALKGIFGKSR